VQYSTYLDWKFSAMKSGQRYRGFIPIRPGETGDIYNGMIRPFRRMPLKGIIYYQGESDVYQPDHIRMLLPHLIRSWRDDRGDPLTPFLVVQIPGWDFNRERPLDEIARQIMPESRMAELREGQLLAVQSQPGTELVVSLDIGEKDEVHPTLKLPLAQRLARAALHLAYQRDTLFRGPRLTGATFLEDRVVLKFSDVGDGLRAAEDPVNGFSIARSNMVHFKPVARITAPDTVTLFSPVWKNPVSAWFAWNDFPVTTLTDSEGNPATSFRVTIDEQ
jgi:sialate O-acetylesterase